MENEIQFSSSVYNHTVWEFQTELVILLSEYEIFKKNLFHNDEK